MKSGQNSKTDMANANNKQSPTSSMIDLLQNYENELQDSLDNIQNIDNRDNRLIDQHNRYTNNVLQTPISHSNSLDNPDNLNSDFDENSSELERELVNDAEQNSTLPINEIQNGFLTNLNNLLNNTSKKSFSSQNPDNLAKNLPSAEISNPHNSILSNDKDNNSSFSLQADGDPSLSIISAIPPKQGENSGANLSSFLNISFEQDKSQIDKSNSPDRLTLNNSNNLGEDENGEIGMNFSMIKNTPIKQPPNLLDNTNTRKKKVGKETPMLLRESHNSNSHISNDQKIASLLTVIEDDGSGVCIEFGEEEEEEEVEVPICNSSLQSDSFLNNARGNSLLDTIVEDDNEVPLSSLSQSHSLLKSDIPPPLNLNEDDLQVPDLETVISQLTEKQQPQNKYDIISRDIKDDLIHDDLSQLQKSSDGEFLPMPKKIWKIDLNPQEEYETNNKESHEPVSLDELDELRSKPLNKKRESITINDILEEEIRQAEYYSEEEEEARNINLNEFSEKHRSSCSIADMVYNKKKAEGQSFFIRTHGSDSSIFSSILVRKFPICSTAESITEHHRQFSPKKRSQDNKTKNNVSHLGNDQDENVDTILQFPKQIDSDNDLRAKNIQIPMMVLMLT